MNLHLYPLYPPRKLRLPRRCDNLGSVVSEISCAFSRERCVVDSVSRMIRTHLLARLRTFSHSRLHSMVFWTAMSVGCCKQAWTLENLDRTCFCKSLPKGQFHSQFVAMIACWCTPYTQCAGWKTCAVLLFYSCTLASSHSFKPS